MNFAEVRAKYPEYGDLSDEQLARGLHKKFYSDLPFEDFSAKVGYGQVAPGPQAAQTVPERGGILHGLERGLKTLGYGALKGTQAFWDVPATVLEAIQAPNLAKPFAALSEMAEPPAAWAPQDLPEKVVTGAGQAAVAIPEIMSGARVLGTGARAMAALGGVRGYKEAGVPGAATGAAEGALLGGVLKGAGVLPKALAVPATGAAFALPTAIKGAPGEDVIADFIVGGGLAALGPSPSWEQFKGLYKERPIENVAAAFQSLQKQEVQEALRQVEQQATQPGGAAPVRAMAQAMKTPIPARRVAPSPVEKSPLELMRGAQTRPTPEPIQQMVKAGLEPAPRPKPPAPEVAQQRAVEAARRQGQQRIVEEIIAPETREAARRAALAAEEEGVTRVAPPPVVEEVSPPAVQAKPAPPLEKVPAAPAKVSAPVSLGGVRAPEAPTQAPAEPKSPKAQPEVMRAPAPKPQAGGGVPIAAKGEPGPEFGSLLGVLGERPVERLKEAGRGVGQAWGVLAERRHEATALKTQERARVVDEAVREFHTPIENNPADRAATAFAKPKGTFKDFIAEMPEFQKLTPAQAEEMKIALRKTRGGHITPAMRKSGFYVSQEFADYPHREPGKLSQAWTDPDRFIQEIDGGKFGGEAQKHILWPMRRTALARMKFTDEWKTRLSQAIERHDITNKRLRQAAGDVIEHIATGKEAKEDPWVLINDKPKLQALLKGLPATQQGKVVAFAQEIRQLFDSLIDAQNQARAKRGQEAIPYRENYRPWIIETNIWARTFGLRQRPKEIMESPELPDYIKPNQPFNPRAEARRGLLGKYEKERNLVTLVQDYIETAGRDVFNANIVHNNKVHAEVLRSKGLLKAADGIDRITAETFAGVKPPLSRFAAETIPPPVRSAMQTIRRNLTRAVFPLNWTWNAFIQTSSAGLTVTRYGVKNSLWGLKYVTDPALREAINRNAYSSVVKSRWAGSAAYQDMARAAGEMKRLDSKPIEKAEHFASYLTQAIENGLTGHGVAAAYRDGQTRLGLKGRELWEYATEGGSKTQSMYNYENIPGLLRNREVGQTAPFQTFAFEVFNTVREMDVPLLNRAVGKTGLYQTINATSPEGQALMSNRLKMLARWTAAIAVTNAVTDYAIGRKAWEISSFIPFYGLLTGGHTRGLPLFTQYLNEFKEGVRSLIAYGSWKKLRRFALRYHLIGGMQVERTLSGIEAASEGGVSDVRGRTLFKVEGDLEKARAITQGPHATAAGIEYRRKLQEKQGIGGAIRKWAEEGEQPPPALDWTQPKRQERKRRMEW